MKPNMGIFVGLIFLELYAIATIINITSFCSGSSVIGCLESEREALLKLKQDFKDPSNRLASWIGDGDCCKWSGVVCNNFTGHVLQLNLANPFNRYYDSFEAYERSQLVGKINPSLLDLKHLTHLDISGNDFQGNQIPKYFGSLENLKYLNLSVANFSGKIPHQLGNLSNLQSIDLSGFDLHADSISWLSGLSLLENLHISLVNLNKASDSLMVIHSLSSLKVLELSYCELSRFPLLSFPNSSSINTIDLSQNRFQGQISNGVGNLTSLRYLDLSFNEFNSTIPGWLYKLNDLEYLSLRGNRMQGTISSIGLENLTNSIKTLDLSGNKELGGKIPSSFARLCKLTSIHISYVKLSQDISEIVDIFSACVAYELESLWAESCQISGQFTNQLGQFKSLHDLDLSDNSLSGPLPPALGELSSLTYLHLSNNSLSGPLPPALGELSSLIQLDLSANSLSGPLPSALGELSSLIQLDLSDNSLSNQLPLALGELSSLTYLDLSNNILSGYIPLSMGKLSHLIDLDLSNNRLKGTISEIHFMNLTKLFLFHASGNSLMFKVNPNWVPPFQLKSLRLRSCHLGPKFPSWLQSQSQLFELDISNTRISDTIPLLFWNHIHQYDYLNLSSNQIYGEIPDFDNPIMPLNNDQVDTFIDLSNNALSGSILHFICQGNNMSKNIGFLKLSKNHFSGNIPDCWMNWPSLIMLNLAHNNFIGSLPMSMGTLSFLSSLNLRNNSLSGIIPMSFQNCSELGVLDLGENEFVGNIPTWMGERLSGLLILNLRSNKFHGVFPIQLCLLGYLHILDVAYNNLSGIIPRCINNFAAMATTDLSNQDNFIAYPSMRDDRIVEVLEDASLVMKGFMADYNSNLNLVRIMDVSKNNFSGEIPAEVTNLTGLQTLNFSHNFFTGNIPENIGIMLSIESLDFSTNQLSGKIPQSMSSLSFLNHLNLSNNNLTGKIPSSTQLQSFDTSCFAGNDLCGAPLPDCTEKSASVPQDQNENGNADEDEDEVDWLLYASMALGFVVGFWGFIGSLLVNRRWRYKYCHFLDGLVDKFGYFVRKRY